MKITDARIGMKVRTMDGISLTIIGIHTFFGDLKDEYAGRVYLDNDDWMDDVRVELIADVEPIEEEK